MKKYTLEQLLKSNFLFDTDRVSVVSDRYICCCITNISDCKEYVSIEGTDVKFRSWLNVKTLIDSVKAIVGVSNLVDSIIQNTKSLHLQQTEKWSKDFGAFINTEISIPDRKTVELRCQLIMEEAKELCDALRNNDIIEAVDGCADLQVVLDGTILALGIQDKMNAISTEVYLSNDSKKDKEGNVLFSPVGKILKSDLFKRPELWKVLKDEPTELSSRK